MSAATSTGHADITLAKGSHDCGDPQRCLFEWYNWLDRAEHTDDCPPGVSRVLHVFGMRLNDALDDDRRQELKRYLPNGTSPLAGTAGDGKDETRSYIALDWLIRTYAPAWLALAGLSGEAAALRGLRRVADLAAAQSAGPVVRAAGDAAWEAAGDAAGGAAWAAAWDAAGDAAGGAAGVAAGGAAGDAAGGAAWAAARAAARAAAWAAAWDAAGDAAGGAAWEAARAAAWAAARATAGDAAWAAARAAARATARAAAGAAARAKLAPTVAELQDSAIGLYDVLIAGEWPAEATP